MLTNVSKLFLCFYRFPIGSRTDDKEIELPNTKSELHQITNYYRSKLIAPSDSLGGTTEIFLGVLQR